MTSRPVHRFLALAAGLAAGCSSSSSVAPTPPPKPERPPVVAPPPTPAPTPTPPTTPADDKTTKPLTEADVKQAITIYYTKAAAKYKGVDVTILAGPIDPSEQFQGTDKNPVEKAYYISASPWNEPGKPVTTIRELVVINRLRLKSSEWHGDPQAVIRFDEHETDKIKKRFGDAWVAAHPFPPKK